MLRLLYRLFWSLLVGLILTVWIVQNNSQIEQLITHKLITLLEKEWDVSLSAQSSRINFFTCSIFLNNGKVIDNKSRCRWSFERAKIHISPIAYFLKKEIQVYVTVDNIAITTAVNNGQINLVEHIKKIVKHKSNDIPLTVCSVRLNNFDITLEPIRLLLTGYFELNKELVGSIVVNNLDAFFDKKPLFQKMHGTCSLKKDMALDDWVFKLSQQVGHECLVAGIWSANKRKIGIRWPTGKNFLTCDFLQQDSIKIQGKLPINSVLDLGRFFSDISFAGISSGMCSINANISTVNPFTRSSGIIGFDNLIYKNISFKHIGLTLVNTHVEDQLLADIVLEQADNCILKGNITWDIQQKSGSLNLINPQVIKPFAWLAARDSHLNWTIKQRNLLLAVEFDLAGKLSGNYKLVMLNQSTNNYLAVKGIYSVANDEIKFIGKTPTGNYEVIFSYKPNLYLKQWEYSVNKNKLINLCVVDQDKRMLEGFVRFSLVRAFFDQSSRRLVLGNQASFLMAINQRDFSHITGSLALQGGKIYVPESRNLIEHISTAFEFDFTHKFFALNNAHIDFCKGRIECNKASVLFDDAYSIKMIHIPIVIDNLLINWKRDFYGFIYGNLLINKLSDHDLNISGTVVAKKSLLKDNIFSQGVDVLSATSLGSLIPTNQRLKVDVHVLTERPIRARTENLDTHASVDVRVHYSHGQDIAQFPQLTGTINLEGGHFKLMRNNLNIEYGKIEFIANQLNDPMIDLMASNRINKYIVTLQATGSLLKPTIILESTPELTQEQIFGLLLVGSENAKLQTDLLAMVQLNLHDILLGSKDKIPKTTALLEALSRPLKYVQITPDFTDQSGRGGIRGTVSVNVNDQLRAQIQKNFNLQEDFSAQVEYFLADDVSIKGFKDQRGDIGAEVEVRLKL